MDENEEQNDELYRLEEPELFRNKYPESKRKSMPASAFCGPGKSFPVQDAEDVIHAAERLHNASGDQSSIKSCVIGKAKANGWPLPDTWKEKKEDRAMDGDLTRSMDPETDEAQMFVPITRIDKDKWEVEGQATSDVVDHYGTIFDYDSSKRAFAEWEGNIREMHQPKAVGSAVTWTPDDQTRRITLRARISKGAADTWEKICDGTLRGFSIAVPRGKYKSKMVERNGQSVPMYYDHKLAEVSVVDVPGSPGCNFAIARADGMLTDIVDTTEESQPETPETDQTRAGAKISHATQSDLHSLRDGHFSHAKKTMQICGCDECSGVMGKMDPDGDGDNDMVPSLDTDGDGGSKNMNQGYRIDVQAEIKRSMDPLLQRVHAMLSDFASRPQTQPQHITSTTDPELTRHIEALETRFNEGIAGVSSLLSEVKGLAEKIAAQPMPGGPVSTPVDKRLATSPQRNNAALDDIAVIQRARELNLISTQEDQVNAAARIIALQNPGR